MSPILCISDFELQCKHLEKFKSHRATKNRPRKSSVFCMYETVALRSPIPNFLRPESYSSAAIFILILIFQFIWCVYLNNIFFNNQKPDNHGLPRFRNIYFGQFDWCWWMSEFTLFAWKLFRCCQLYTCYCTSEFTGTYWNIIMGYMYVYSDWCHHISHSK